ncbi:hypothetical protein LPJ53_005433 [Coemansia erecta]|uniref:RNI-like protein n=1 Tax=Coemansia erecta TaxID=147472 RepID=A0A9W8CPV4_9FUNG|nr:hypothetical protein LPJ53_005433 [Coemansia erecta]
MEPESTKASSGALVFGNGLIFDSIASLLEPADMLQISLTCRLGWKYAISGLWTNPVLLYTNNFRGFVQGVEKRLLFKHGNNERYGDLVRAINLSGLGGRWERVGKNHIEQIFKFCPQLQYLDINLCQHISDEHIVGIFSRNPTTCQSLRYLDISETMFQDETVAAMLGCTKNLTTLVMNETEIATQTVKTVAGFLTGLRSLEISDCFNIDGHDINEIARSCTSIMYLNFDEDLEDDAKEAIQLIKARGGSVRGDYDETIDVLDEEYDEFDESDESIDYEDNGIYQLYPDHDMHHRYHGHDMFHPYRRYAQYEGYSDLDDDSDE